MKKFLRSIGILEEFSIHLDCPKSYFIKNLEQHVDRSGFELFEAITSGPAFKGRVDGDSFSIRKRKKMFASAPSAIVKMNGIVKERNEKSIVTLETNINSSLPATLLVVVAFLVFKINALAFNNSTLENLILVIAGQLVFMTAIFYLQLRGSVNRARNAFTQDLHWIAKNYRR